MKSLAEVLSDDNRALLNIIRDTRPESVTSLAAATGRTPGNLSRTLKTMSNYGIVEMRREKKQVRPIAKVTEFKIVAG
jgi:predicted transcriptional regulator